MSLACLWYVVAVTFPPCVLGVLVVRLVLNVYVIHISCGVSRLCLWCVIAMRLRCDCDAIAMRLRCDCDAIAMRLLCDCYVIAM